LVLWQAAQATAAGVLIGVAAALTIAALLAGATGLTPWSLTPAALGIAAALTVICAVSAAVPAIRVYRVSPAAALR
jgi:ABC-type antimicrobial peptide transport system permease subunit